MKEQQKRKFKQIHPEIEDGIDLRRCPLLSQLVSFLMIFVLVFVTDITDYIRGEKSVMWRNFKFLYTTDVEKSKIHPHVD